MLGCGREQWQLGRTRREEEAEETLGHPQVPQTYRRWEHLDIPQYSSVFSVLSPAWRLALALE